MLSNCNLDTLDLLIARSELWYRNDPDRSTKEFMKLMKNWKKRISDLLAENLEQSSSRPLRIAVLDTGFSVDQEDPFFSEGTPRRVNLALSKNFHDIDSSDLRDTHGHGTHIVRLLLTCTVSAEIVVVKICDESTMERVRLAKLIEVRIQISNDWTQDNVGLTTVNAAVQALEYAGKHADLINLSFGLGPADSHVIRPYIKRVVENNKLVFAAASNTGALGKRAFPASQEGVFAIHALRADGSSPGSINPPPESRKDNFATLGFGIPSWSKGSHILIKGTSHATPIAAAIAANILEFVQRADQGYQLDINHFRTYDGMRRLLSLLTVSSGSSSYTYIQPWKDGMFDSETDIRLMWKKLRNLQVFGRMDKSTT